MESHGGRLPSYFPLERYGVSTSTLLPLLLGCKVSAIRHSVIMTPIWHADTFKEQASRVEPVATDRVYDLHYRGSIVTLIRSGVGAPLTGDIVLSLAESACTKVLFTGSVGGLINSLSIGDLMVPSYSISGDGFSTYLSESLAPTQSFFGKAFPEPGLQKTLEEFTRAAARGTDVMVDKGPVFSIDSIVSQFQHLDRINSTFGCMGIEMETAATFRASKLIGIAAAALLQFSDVIPLRKTLFSGMTTTEQDRRRSVRRNVLARALLETAIKDS